VKLRNAHLAIVERSKIVDYLLNSAHPDNGGKALFFERTLLRWRSPKIAQLPMGRSAWPEPAFMTTENRVGAGTQIIRDRHFDHIKGAVNDRFVRSL
jgi:hypothetical protein